MTFKNTKRYLTLYKSMSVFICLLSLAQSLCSNNIKNDQIHWDQNSPLKYYTIDNLLKALNDKDNKNLEIDEILELIYNNIPNNNLEKENADKTIKNKRVKLSKKTFSQIKVELINHYAPLALSKNNLSNKASDNQILKEGISSALFDVRGKGKPWNCELTLCRVKDIIP